MENLDKLPETDDELYIVCRSGGRSFQVAQWLNANGFEAINVAGGMDIWFESGLPMESIRVCATTSGIVPRVRR